MTRAGLQTLVSRRWLGRNCSLTASVARMSNASCPCMGPRNGFRTLAVSQGVLDPSNQDTRRRSGKLWGLRHRTWTADSLFTSQNLSRLGAMWDSRIPNNTHSVRHPRAVLWLISSPPPFFPTGIARRRPFPLVSDEVSLYAALHGISAYTDDRRTRSGHRPSQRSYPVPTSAFPPMQHVLAPCSLPPIHEHTHPDHRATGVFPGVPPFPSMASSPRQERHSCHGCFRGQAFP